MDKVNNHFLYYFADILDIFFTIDKNLTYLIYILTQNTSHICNFNLFHENFIEDLL
jgi:hypothetical protein